MGRPIKDQWINSEDATHASLTGDSDGNEIIMGLCKINQGTPTTAEYTILQQKGSNKFRVQDSASKTGTCTLVNKPETVGALTTTPVLGNDEMIINCKDSTGAVHRVMKLMNRTLIYQADGSTTNVRAMWGWGAAAVAAGTDSGSIETVQLEDIESAGTTEFVTDA